MNGYARITAAVFATLLFATGCTPAPKPEPAPEPAAAPEATEEAGAPARMANPASEYCVSQGGTLEIVTGDTGDQGGMCHLPDGTVIEEWELFHRDHPQPEPAEEAPGDA